MFFFCFLLFFYFFFVFFQAEDFFFQAEDGIRDFCLSRGLGDVYKRQPLAYNDEDVACAPGMYLNDIGYATDMPETTVPEKDFPLQDYSILIIDDEMDIRSFIKTSFSGVFKQIYSADDGVNGLHVVHQCQPDLVICDIMMPHLSLIHI